MVLFNSNEMKKILKISDCKLMHQRVSGTLKFEKKGNAFFYHLPKDSSVLSHPLGEQLLNWHKVRHNSNIDNTPKQPETINALESLVKNILIPIERNFGSLRITYGFTSFALKKFIAKNSPQRTAPNIDQHASYELNSKEKLINKRGGAACDVIGSKCLSSDLVRFITQNLPYDRVYFYGKNKPLHVSFNHSPTSHLQIMKESANGKLFPSTRAFGPEAIQLAETL